ncbi:hypothetical protein GCM10022254_02220 [Actinomadura meridiana]|uniref:Uncharacterized protein n=1 Tax=Actinomadura meridiana TaxID=559626 RepID=A0ABP8BS14_9ACTN
MLAAALLLAEGSGSRTVRLILVACAAGTVAVLGAAMVGAHQATRRERRIIERQAFHFEDARRRLAALEFSLAQGRRELQELVGRVAAGKVPPAREGVAPRPAPGDAIAHLAHSVHQAHTEAWNAVVGAASVRPPVSPVSESPPGRQVGVFVSLARRIQSLSHRVIQGLDELEDEVEDPDPMATAARNISAGATYRWERRNPARV